MEDTFYYLLNPCQFGTFDFQQIDSLMPMWKVLASNELHWRTLFVWSLWPLKMYFAACKYFMDAQKIISKHILHWFVFAFKNQLNLNGLTFNFSKDKNAFNIYNSKYLLNSYKIRFSFMLKLLDNLRMNKSLVLLNKLDMCKTDPVLVRASKHKSFFKNSNLTCYSI